MTLLVLGVALFTLLHFVPIFASETRTSVIGRIGTLPYKGLYALASIAAFYFIYKGWVASESDYLYVPPAWGAHITALLTLAGFVLFFSSGAPTNIKRHVRHPQLTGVILWSAGHLISNGEIRSITLFAGFGIWAAIAIVGLNRRDGEWDKPEKQPVVKDIITILIGVVLYALFALWGHEFLIGVQPVM